MEDKDRKGPCATGSLSATLPLLIHINPFHLRYKLFKYEFCNL